MRCAGGWEGTGRERQEGNRKGVEEGDCGRTSLISSRGAGKGVLRELLGGNGELAGMSMGNIGSGLATVDAKGCVYILSGAGFFFFVDTGRVGRVNRWGIERKDKTAEEMSALPMAKGEKG